MTNLRLGQYAGPSPGTVAVDLPSYISGYVDGEGCFTVSISPRPTLRVGWEVRPSLSVSQNGDRAEVLELIREYFGCGTFRPDRSDKTVKWEVRSLQLLVKSIIPHFEQYPLLSGKRYDFSRFAAICERMERGDHRHASGLQWIVRTAAQMNPSGMRRYLPAEVLRTLNGEVKA